MEPEDKIKGLALKEERIKKWVENSAKTIGDTLYPVTPHTSFNSTPGSPYRFLLSSYGDLDPFINDTTYVLDPSNQSGLQAALSDRLSPSELDNTGRRSPSLNSYPTELDNERWSLEVNIGGYSPSLNSCPTELDTKRWSLEVNTGNESDEEFRESQGPWRPLNALSATPLRPPSPLPPPPPQPASPPATSHIQPGPLPPPHTLRRRRAPPSTSPPSCAHVPRSAHTPPPPLDTQKIPPQPSPPLYARVPRPSDTPPPPPTHAGVPGPSCAPPPPYALLKLPPSYLSAKNCFERKKGISENPRKGNDATLDASKATNNNEQEVRMELNEKVEKLKEEFSSLPKVLIKRTLCGDDVNGDITKARQRLQEFKQQLKDPKDSFKNQMGAKLVVGKLNLYLNNYPVIKLDDNSKNRFEERERENLLPKNWIPMPRDDRGNDVTVHLVKLASSSAEYQDVGRRFHQTAPSNLMINTIERVQNPFLYQGYQLRKQKMDRDNGGNNERQLFHGTNPDNVTKINTQGFDRSFAGSAHGARYGTGVYFARDASYSVSYTDRSRRVMYLARVLVGKYCKGKQSMRKPPPINPEQPEILFDSMVDDLHNPSIFVVYYDNQCYPEYLITF